MNDLIKCELLTFLGRHVFYPMFTGEEKKLRGNERECEKIKEER